MLVILSQKMSLSSYQTKVQTLIRDISTLEKKISEAMNKETQKEKQKVSILQSIQPSTSINTKLNKQKQGNEWS